MQFELKGHQFVTVIDEEESTFWWEREKAKHICRCGQSVVVIPSNVGNPYTGFRVESAEELLSCVVE